jgi:hypothetical protein
MKDPQRITDTRFIMTPALGNERDASLTQSTDPDCAQPLIATRDQHGRPIFLKQRAGERLSACCLQSEPCAWHAQHGDEIYAQHTTARAAVPIYGKRKPTPPRVRRYLESVRAEGAMFESDDEFYDYLLAKRAQWEAQPLVDWTPFIAYMLSCEYADARAMARWLEHEHCYEPASADKVRCAACGKTQPRCTHDFFDCKNHYVCARPEQHEPPHRAGKVIWA